MSDTPRPTDPPRVRHVIGCMTGTSLDGLDAALTRITGSGLDMTAEFVGMVSADLPDDLRTTLLSMANGEAHPPLDFLRAARHLGVVHAEACAELIAKHGQATETSGGVDFVVAHGQTIWHAPADRVSWQLFDPWPIVRALKLPVCYDLRQADLVAGGEGAPITPIADWVMYRRHADAVLNLGGICNVTRLGDGPSALVGGDLFPCNLLLDGLCQRLLEQRYDSGGEAAASGVSSMEANFTLAQRVAEQTRGQRTLGREQMDAAWLDATAEALRNLGTPADLLRTAVEFIGLSLAEAKELQSCRQLVLGGGGVRNGTLIEAIRRHRPKTEIKLSDDLGIPAEAREAMGFAVLGALSADGVPITLPRVTGAEEPGVAGVWAYPDGPPYLPNV